MRLRVRACDIGIGRERRKYPHSPILGTDSRPFQTARGADYIGPMAMAFSDPWAQAWGAALNASSVYRKAAATWEGSIAVVVSEAFGRAGPAVFLDVWRGQCRAAREATAADVADAAFVLEAAPAAWKQVLASQISPVMALLTGQIRLARGDLTRLLPYTAAAKELVHLAGTIETEFPPNW